MAEPDDALARNLDTQHRRLTELEQHVDALLRGETPPTEIADTPQRPERYADLTVTNDALRADRGWSAVDLDAALSPEALAEFELWRARRRLPWQADDVLAVAAAGVIGIAATLYDTTIDHVVRDRLAGLKDLDLVRRWENDARRLPIDYMGPGFGGALHRVRSAGHDIGRPFEALRQIRAGEFHGYRWVDGVRESVRVTGYTPVEDLGEALVLWGKHLVADFVGVTNLPLPGWTKLYELDNRTLRRFAHEAYGADVNLRSVSLSALPVMTTEIVIRTHAHGRAMLRDGTALLKPAEKALRAELLLAAHSIVGAASLGRAVAAMIGTAPTVAGSALALRHVNWPVLMRVAATSLEVARDSRRRRSTAASWDDLLAGVAAPWQLDEAEELERAV
jgi:hypothetical protein